MYYIGYDIGSSSIKAAIVEMHTGRALETVREPREEMKIISFQSGWAEQDPDTWWNYVCKATRELLKLHHIDPADINGIGIAYQMHGLVIVDKKGRSLRNSIIWCDGRAVTIGAEAYEKIGMVKCDEQLLNSPANFTASKLKWVQENEAEVYAAIHKMMLPGDYIAYKLSGAINTTISGLSEGIFWDYQSDHVSDLLLNHYNLDPGHIPNLVETFSEQAVVSAKGAAESGLAAGTPILYRAGDQPNNALCLNVFEPGEIAASAGTSGVVYTITDNLSVTETSKVNNFVHVNHKPSQKRIGRLLCINGTGIQYRWLRDRIDVAGYEEMNTLAAKVPVGSEGLIITPFGNGPERMFENKDPGAQISGIRFNVHNNEHLCRAALEGIAFSFAYGMEILGSGGISAAALRAANDNLFRSEIFSQTLATLIERDIEIYNTTGAIGAARACALLDGDFENYGRQIAENDYLMRYEPMENSGPYRQAYAQWKNTVENILKNT